MDLVIQGKSNHLIIGIGNDQKNVAVQRSKDTIFNLLDIKKAHHNKWTCLLLFDISDSKNIPEIVQVSYRFLFQQGLVVFKVFPSVVP